MIENDHKLNSGSRKWIAAGLPRGIQSLTSIKSDVLGIPESEEIDHPVVISSLPGDEPVPFAV